MVNTAWYSRWYFICSPTGCTMPRTDSIRKPLFLTKTSNFISNRVINIQLQLHLFTVQSKICLSSDYQFSTYRNSTAETGRLLEKSYKLTVGKVVVARDEFNSVDSFMSFIFACISLLSLKNCLCSRNNCD